MLGPHTITVLRAGAAVQDEFGNDVPGPTSEFTVAGCSVQPGTGSRYPDPSREATSTAYTVWAPLEPRVLDTDRIRWDSMLFEVDGSVGRWAVTPGHQTIPLKVVTG